LIQLPATPATGISIKRDFPDLVAASTASLISRYDLTRVASTPIDLAKDWKSTRGVANIHGYKTVRVSVVLRLVDQEILQDPVLKIV
jgi:hypothetical protein